MTHEDESVKQPRGNVLCWQRADPVSVIGPAFDDRALRALEGYYGAFPITLARSDVPLLRALSEVGGGRPLGDLIEVVEREGAIRVWWETRQRSRRVIVDG